VLGGFAAVHADGADPCRFADVNLRDRLTANEWTSVHAVGVAFFAEPDATAPVSTLVVVAR
jgi:hypothetical protein